MSTPLTLALANSIIAAALQHAREAGYKPMSVVVVDDAGHVRSAQREDGASMFRTDIALGKAWAAVAMGVSTRVLTQRARDVPSFFNALASAGQGKFIPQTGAVVIFDEAGRVIGAAGASGGSGDEDEEICIAAIHSVDLQTG